MANTYDSPFSFFVCENPFGFYISITVEFLHVSLRNADGPFVCTADYVLENF